MPRLYAFDIDHTLECSDGPVRIADVAALRDAGHIVGLCGNWAMAVRCQDEHARWDRVFSFLGPLSMTKADFLAHLMKYVGADEYVLVGNSQLGHAHDPGPMRSNDDEHARLAGYRFILEADFARGVR